MIDCCTQSFSSTWSIAWATDWSTLFIATCVSIQTIIIHATLHLDTGHIRVAFITLLTGADWLVIDDAAERMVSTGTWIFADLVDTGVSLSTLIISVAARQDGSQGLAAVVVIRNISIRTGADHGAHWQRVNDGAGGGVSTWAELGTEELTPVVETSVL